MRRKRRTKYIWFPVQGTQGETTADDNVGFPTGPVLVTGISGAVSDPIIFTVIPDAPKEAATSLDDNLADFTLNEYFLKRIVGKIQWGVQQTFTASAAVPRKMALGVGFFVARAEGTGVVPIGATTAADRSENYGPLNANTVREPWIWRRTWVFDLSPVNNETTGVLVPGFYDTRQAGSVLDGGHIDAKTARRIKSDERLYIALQGGNADDLDTTPEFSQLIGNGWLDVRILGQMRKPKSSGTF